MLLKKQVILTETTHRGVSKVSKEEQLESSYALKVAELEQAIRDLPKNCPFIRHAQDVLDHIESLRRSNAHFIYPFATPLEVLDKTTAILKSNIKLNTAVNLEEVNLKDVNIELAKTDIDLDYVPSENQAYLQLLQDYNDYGSKLKLSAGFKILGGLLCALAAVVLLAVIVAGLFFITTWGGPAAIKVTPMLVGAIFSGAGIIAVLQGLSIVGAEKLIRNGVKSLALANSMQKFLAKVNEPASIAPLTPFQKGFELLNTNPEKALQCFAAVKEGDLQYTQAQSMIAAYTPTSKGAPHSPNTENLLATDPSINLAKRKQLKAEREGYSLVDQVADVPPVPTARRKLNYNSAADVQVLIGEVIDHQQTPSLK